MLILTRRIGESIQIDLDPFTPPDMNVVRSELLVWQAE